MGAAIALVFLCFLVILIILIILFMIILFFNVFFHIFFCGGYRCLLASIIHTWRHTGRRGPSGHTQGRAGIAGRPIFWRTDRGAIGFIADIGPISGRYRPI